MERLVFIDPFLGNKVEFREASVFAQCTQHRKSSANTTDDGREVCELALSDGPTSMKQQ